MLPVWSPSGAVLKPDKPEKKSGCDILFLFTQRMPAIYQGDPLFRNLFHSYLKCSDCYNVCIGESQKQAQNQLHHFKDEPCLYIPKVYWLDGRVL